MHQNWGKLLFMHWPIDEHLLRPLIPSQLQLDTFDGSTWVAIAPFTMWDIQALPPFVPSIPGLSSMHELNVRTYVHHEGVPGVWFFSLDISNAAAALAGRKLYHLPYHAAEIQLEEDGERIHYRLRRNDDLPANFQASWTIGKPLSQAQPGSREFFLTERYVLYAEHRDALYRARIHHQPWPLREAQLAECSTNMFEVNGLPMQTNEPLLHYAEEVNVDIWFLERISNP
jgi:uncharacterized protein YqjF (DUF2071 family)